MKTPREWIIEYPVPVNTTGLTMPSSPWKLEEWIIISEQRWRKRAKRRNKQMADLCNRNVNTGETIPATTIGL